MLLHRYPHRGNVGDLLHVYTRRVQFRKRRNTLYTGTGYKDTSRVFWLDF